VEADEYKRAFLEYTPSVAVITNVEPDHLDYYGTAEAYHEAFVDFAKRITPGGTLLACWDDPGARQVSEMVEDEPIRVETYGTEGVRFWQATNVDCGGGEARFTLTRGGRVVGELRAGVPGLHFVRNATAGAAVSLGLGVDFGTVQRAVARFQGARRRFQPVGEAGGVLVMDDYAHHPSEVRATIATARTRFPERGSSASTSRTTAASPTCGISGRGAGTGSTSS
jgi:UDP-N-acetylmuramate--alanine ligase